LEQAPVRGLPSDFVAHTPLVIRGIEHQAVREELPEDLPALNRLALEEALPVVEPGDSFPPLRLQFEA